MKNWHLGAAVATIVAILGAFALLFRPSGTGAPPPVVQDPTSGQYRPAPTATPSDVPKQEIQGNASVFSGHDPVTGRLSWTLKATSILMRDAEKRADARDITCTFYGNSGQPVAIVKSRGCAVNLSNNNLQFAGRVTAVDPSGQTLIVEHLRYDGRKKRFFGHGGVRVTRATSVLLADKVWADPTLKTVQLDGNVQAFVHSIAVGTPSPVATPTVPPLPPEGDPSPSSTSPAPPSGSPTKDASAAPTGGTLSRFVAVCEAAR